MYDIFITTFYWDKPPLVQRFSDIFNEQTCWTIAMKLEIALRADPFVRDISQMCINTLGS